MADLFEVQSASGAHVVRIVETDLKSAVVAAEPSVILADAFFRDALAGITHPIVFIEAVEEAKDLTRVPELMETCRRYGLTRDGHLVAIGGGVVQDIACFVASTYMRGVNWTYFPTTLLAMADSCIGGKSSINVGEFKNLVGTFYPPAAVVIVPGVTQSLPPEHLAAGRAEAAKICFARGNDAFDRYLGIDTGAGQSPADLIALSLFSKKWFIEIDEFDRAERLLLNFGHSFGHALESCSSYMVPHGVAVGVGCLAAVAASCDRDPALRINPRVEQLNAQLLSILAPLAGLGTALAEVQQDAFFRYWDSDKKHSATTYRPILLDENAQLYRAALPRDAESADFIWRGFCAARDMINHQDR